MCSVEYDSNNEGAIGPFELIRAENNKHKHRNYNEQLVGPVVQLSRRRFKRTQTLVSLQGSNAPSDRVFGGPTKSTLATLDPTSVF